MAQKETSHSIKGIQGDNIEQQVKDLLSKMSLDEKIGQMSGRATSLDLLVMAFWYNRNPYESGENKRLGIPAIRFTDGPRGVTVGHSTCFPVSIARGATFDPELEERISNAMGIEARSQGANFFAGICINLLRHPGWGRAQETFGEDPYLLGVMGRAMIRGLKSHVMTCVKHFACNSIEESRFKVNVQVDERSLREIYLPHFKECVDAGAASIMSAYNQVNNEYCGQSSYLLRDILKKEWDFKGFVISDFVFGLHNGKKGALGGLDIEMPNTRYYGNKLKKLVLKGEVSEKIINEAVTRILRQKIKFSALGDSSEYSENKIACPEHTALSLEAARKSIVLLKNENRALPINRKQIKTIAVIGRQASKANIGDKGSSRVRPPYAVTPLEGIKAIANDVRIKYYGGYNLKKAASIAKEADAAIIITGLTHKEEGEYMVPLLGIGGDREFLGLPQKEISLLNAVAQASRKCIVLLQGGSAITMEGWTHSADAILMAWYPGMEGGNAIAEIIFGDVNPSGKLPVSVPVKSDETVYFNKKAKTIDYRYYLGYRYYDIENLEPAFPFGFGLSYTEFQYSNLMLDKKEIGREEALNVRVDITNTGDFAGEEVVQLYIGYQGSAVKRPIKELKGFDRVALNPGETKTVGLKVKAPDLAYYDAGSKGWVIEDIEYIVYTASSSRKEDLHLKSAFRIRKSV